MHNHYDGIVQNQGWTVNDNSFVQHDAIMLYHFLPLFDYIAKLHSDLYM